MRNDTRSSGPDRRYAAAHELHYGAKNLQEALQLYKEILLKDVGTPEAGFARSQIHNIVKSVVPDQALFDAGVQLAHQHFQHRQDLYPAPARPTAVAS
jgi:hypothetical protein